MRLARSWLAPALLAGALSACSACAAEPTSGGGVGGGGGAATTSSSTSTTSSSSGTTSSCDPWPAPHAADPEGKIDWEGWTTHPWLPSCCHGIYLPDDLALRVPQLSYKPCPGNPPGCQQIDTSAWHWNDIADKNFGDRLVASGPGPEWLVLSKRIAKAINENVLYASDGQPVAAWRQDASTTEINCGTFKGVAFDTAGTIALLELGTRIDGVMRQGSFVAPPAELDSLAVPQIVKEEPGGLAALAVSSELVAWNTGGAVRAGRVATGEIWNVGPGGVPGASTEWFSPRVVGDTVLAWEHEGIWAHQAGVTVELRDQPAGGIIVGFGTDGQTLVWLEGLGGKEIDNKIIYDEITLYTAPFTTDPASFDATALAQLPSDSGSRFSGLTVANGHTVIPYGASFTTGGVPAARLVRLSDGAQWEVAPPEGQGWRRHFYPAAEHVWVTTGRSPGGVIVTDITRLAIAELEPVP